MRHGSAHNPACGDKVEMDVALDAGRIAALAHETKACVLAQASAAILGRDAKGLTRDDVAALRAEVAAMLAQSGAVAGSALRRLCCVRRRRRISTAATRCVLLPIDALLDALDRLRGG